MAILINMKKKYIIAVGWLGLFVLLIFLYWGFSTKEVQPEYQDENLRGRGVLPYPLSKNDQRTIERSLGGFIEDKILDSLWGDFYIYDTAFESLDGFNTSVGSATQLDGGVFLQSPGTGVATSTIYDLDANPTSFTAESRFRMLIFSGTTTDMTVFLTVGNVEGALDAYGFMINDDSLLGLAQTGKTARSTIDLGVTIVKNTFYLLEARYIPNQVVQFYVTEDTEVITNKSSLRGVLRTNLPVDDNFNFIFYASIAEKTAFQKHITISSYRYIQKQFQR